MNVPRVVIGGTCSGVGRTSAAIGIMGALLRIGERFRGLKMTPTFWTPAS